MKDPRVFAIIAVLFLTGCAKEAQTSEDSLPVWAASDSVKIFRDFPVQKDNAVWSSKDSAIKLQAARNETIAFQVVLNGGEAGLTQASVAASDLRGAQNTGVIPQSQFQFFLEWYTCVQGEKDTRCYPDALIPFYDPYSTPEHSVAAPFQVKPRENQPVWVDIKIPKDAEAGVYNGTLQVLSKEEPSRIIHILLTVLPFTIPDERHITAYSDLYGMGKEGVRNIFGDDWPVMARYWVMAREHRFDFNSEGHELDPVVSSMWGEDGQYEYDPQTWMAYDEYYGQVLRGEIFPDGLPPNVWRLPFPEAKQSNLYGINCKYFQPSTWDKAEGCYDTDYSFWENKIKSLALEIETHFKEKEMSGEWPKGTLERSFVYTIDEPKQNDYYYLYIKDYAALIHQAAPSIKFMLTEQPEEPLFGSVDIWAPMASTFAPKRMLERKKKGEKIWFYQAAEPYLGDHKLSADAIALRMWAWAAWKYRVDAVFLWACNYWSSENPYTDPQVYEQGRATNNYGDGYIFYPGRMLEEIGLPAIEGPVSSIRMKMWRRGFLDYEYMWVAAQKGREKDVDVIVSGMVKSAMAENYKEITDPISCAKKRSDGQKTKFVDGKCIGACADFSNKACAYNEGVLIGPWDCDDGPDESGKYPQWWEDPRVKKFNGWSKDPDAWVRARYKIAALLTE